MNFGVVGVFFGAAILGWLFERVFMRLVTDKSAQAETLIYYAALVALLLHYVRGEFTAPTLLLITILGPVWLARRLASSSSA